MLPTVTMRGRFGRGPLRVIAGAALALSTAGCATTSSSSTATAGRPSTVATLEISAPAPNAVTGRNVNLVLRLGHARLVPPTQVGGRLYPDRGHIHVSVDGQLVAMPLRLTDALPTLSPGVHTVEAEFVASDHLPFANRVVAAVTFRTK
jgi:hypothetical protein